VKKRKGKRSPLKNNTPERDKIRVTFSLLWRVVAPGLKPLRLPRAKRSCKQTTQPLPTKEAAELGSRAGPRRVYSFRAPLRERGSCKVSLYLNRFLSKREMGDIQSGCDKWMSSTWDTLSFSWPGGVGLRCTLASGSAGQSSGPDLVRTLSTYRLQRHPERGGTRCRLPSSGLSR